MADGDINRVDELEQGDLVEFEASGTSGIPSAVVTASILDPPFPPEDVSDDQIPGAVTVALENPDSKAKWNFRQQIDPDTDDLAGDIEVSVKACIDIRHPPRYRWQDRGTLEFCEVVGEREVADAGN